MRKFDKNIIPVFIVPTGLGCEIGGHAGDANPAVKLIAAASDLLITHPNAVNASDINEMPENSWYVEGSILDRFLEGSVQLKQPISHNKILVAVNNPVTNDTINAVSAARMTLGADISIVVLKKSLMMIATKLADGSASGTVDGWQELVDQVMLYDFDALAITTKIDVEQQVAADYVKFGGVNPWGAVEAVASRFIATALDKPVAHSPFGHTLGDDFSEIVDSRMAAEFVSECYLHCILKGLHRAPRVEKGFAVQDISCLITPTGCWGRPHKACRLAGVPIIAVKENTPYLVDLAVMPDTTIMVDNYLEAAGMLMAMRAGIDHKTVRRPAVATEVIDSV